MSEALVSIVITSYNYAHLLPQAIESALGQDYEHLEVLVLDNASTDETPAVLARYADDPRLRVIRNETNIGLTPNHNKGLREARGDFIGFLSADDALVPGIITKVMQYYRSHPDVDVLYGSAYFMDADSRAFGIRQMGGQPPCAYAGGRNELAALLADGCYMCMPTMVVRRSIWERYGGFDEEMHAADWEITARWARNGLRFAYLPDAFAFVRLHAEQYTGNKRYVATGRDMRESLAIFERNLDTSVPERYAGYENSIRRLIDSRMYWARQSFAEAADEYVDTTTSLLTRVASIAARNAGRVRRRVCYIVVAGPAIGPLERTLRSLVAQREPAWRAVVVQRPGISYEPLCRSIDPVRVRHLHVVTDVWMGRLLNTAVQIEDADIYTIVRAGTTIGENHAAELIATFGDPEARIAVSWPKFFVDAPGGVEPILIEELSHAPTGAFDVLVGPEVPPEAIAFAREIYDHLAGFNTSGPSLVDWEFLVRATMSASSTFRPTKAQLELHIMPGNLDFMPNGPNGATALASIDALHRAYPVGEPERLERRTAFLARLRAALQFDTTHQAGLVDFFRTLARTGVTT